MLLTDSTLRCSSCREHKPFDAFRANKSNTRCNGRHNQCKKCDNAAHAKYYQRNKRKITSAILERKYGITLDDYERMADEQGHACALCGEPEVVKGRRMAVDHDHETGRVRGLLCFKCNTAMGRVADTEAALDRLVAYVRGESCQ